MNLSREAKAIFEESKTIELYPQITQKSYVQLTIKTFNEPNAFC